MAVLLGQDTTGVNSANSNSAGVAFAQKYTALATGTITAVWIRSGATIPTAANCHWAIYAGSGATPDARLTADNSGQAPTANDWASFPISPGLDVTEGTAYWIAFLGVSVQWAYTNFADSGGTEYDGSGGSTLPDPFNDGGGNSNVANVYATGDVGTSEPAAETLHVVAGPRLVSGR